MPGEHSSDLKVTALAISSALGGTERVLLDYARHAFETGVLLTVIVPSEGPLTAALARLGVRVVVAPAPAVMLSASQRGAALLAAPIAVAALTLWATELAGTDAFAGADVIYSLGFKPHLAAAFAARQPVVWHLHEFPPEATHHIWRFVFNRGPVRAIANSQVCAAAWKRPGAPPIVPILNGVDLYQFRPRARTRWIHRALGLRDTARLVGMPAVWARWKGQPEVIQAFLDATAGREDTHLVLIGGAIYDTVAEREYAVELERLVEQAGPRVHLLGFRDDIELAYPELDLVVHYSLRPEPFGRVVLEALASGVPVVASAEGGPPEILGRTSPGQGRGGWLATPRDPRALAHWLEIALSIRPDELAVIGVAGRQRAESEFSAQRFAARVSHELAFAAEGRQTLYQRRHVAARR